MPANPPSPHPPPQPAPAPTAAVLILEALHFGYRPNEPVIQNVSTMLKPGRVTCLLGPNAAGKSTLVKLMLGQLTPWAGRVQITTSDNHPKPVTALTARQRARSLSYVPQRAGVQFAFTVRQVVAMGRFAAGTSVRQHAPAIDHALAACDLLDVADRIFAELSGGQQQRVLLARAIAQATDQGRAMLLDEPGSHLDLRHLHAMMALLHQQAEQGLAVLVVLHDLNLAARYADDIWLMDQGQLVAAGHWSAILRPEILEPVYRLKLEPLTPATSETSPRPVFQASPLE